MMRTNKYSKINTKTKIVNINKRKFFDKRFQINVKPMNTKKNLNKIFILLKNYVFNLRKSNISLPEITQLKLNSNSIFCRMEYKGKNLFMLGLNEKNFLNFKDYFNQIIEIILTAKKQKINIDPHLKNFVVDENKIYYVDIFPPYSNDLKKIRQNYYINSSEKKIVNSNFEFFKPKNLFYHFVSDLIKINPKFESRINYIYKILKKKKVINSDKNNFNKIVKKILHTEKLREKKNLYLI